MKSIEERLWSYIDGTCPADEQQGISVLISQDETWRSQYQEILSFNAELLKMEADEPSMGFTFRVMEDIRTEHALKPLKSQINKRIILGVSVFFIVTILALLAYILSSVHITNSYATSSVPHLKLPAKLNAGELQEFLSGPIIKVFLFFDIVLGLFLFDAFLRKRKVSEQS